MRSLNSKKKNNTKVILKKRKKKKKKKKKKDEKIARLNQMRCKNDVAEVFYTSQTNMNLPFTARERSNRTAP